MPDEIPPALLTSVTTYSTINIPQPKSKQLSDSQSSSSAQPFFNSHTFQTLFPVFLLIFASLMYSLMHCAVRLTSQTLHISITFIIFFRSITTVILSTIFIIHSRQSILSHSLSPKFLFLLILRGLMGAISMLLHYAALTKLPVAIATTLFCTKPIFASFFALLFLNEHLTTFDKLALLISTFGTTIIGFSQPFNSSQTSIQYFHGIILALIAAAATGAIYVLMRTMGTRVHYMLSVFSMSTCGSISAILLYIIHDGSINASFTDFAQQVKQLHGHALFWLLCVGAFAFVGCVCMNRGSQLVPAGRAAVLRTGDIPINFVVGALLLDELPHSMLQIFGCCLIAVSAYIVASKSAS